MSQHAETKRHFRLAMVQGTPPVAPTPAHSRRWTRQFLEVLPVELAAQPRLVNVFKIGADPEFVFADLDRGIRLDAETFGLKTGIAFGADMNGRLVELRPRASRSALDVLASILEELRWLANYKPKAANMCWRAGAFLYKDGIGGHVHLGRKRGLKQVREWARYFNSQHGTHREPRRDEDSPAPMKPAQLARMDLLFHALTELGVYNKEQVTTRQRGDQHGQRYGLYGDVRMQAHGYEYRAYPSWLDHPLSAYLALVLTKLAAYDPDVLPDPQVPLKNTEQCQQLVKNLLAYYKGRDDDAAIAYAAIHRQGMPVYCGDDFKQRWGIAYSDARIPGFIPDMIAGAEETKRELFEFLMNGHVLEFNKPRVTWNPAVPVGYRCCLEQIQTTRGQRGLGELAVDLYYHERQPVILQCGNDRDWVIGSQLRVAPAGRQMLMKAGSRLRSASRNCSVHIPQLWREPAQLARTKEILEAMGFCWRIGTLQTSPPPPAPVKATAKPERLIGKILA